jgi:hypothetical protein
MQGAKMQLACAKVDVLAAAQAAAASPAIAAPAAGPVLVFDNRVNRNRLAERPNAVHEVVVTEELVERANRQLMLRQLITA